MNNRTFASTWPVLAKLLAVVCILLTLGAALRMEIRLFPDRVLPEYTVRLSAPGMSAEMIDEQVARPVEEAIRATGLAPKISTRSQASSASITIRTKAKLFGDDREKLEQKLKDVTASLPVSDWKLMQSNLADDRIGYYLVHGADLQTIAELARGDVSEKVGAIPGVSRVLIDDSSVREEIELIFRPTMLQTYSLTPGDVLGQLQGKGSQEQMGTIGKGVDQTHFRWGNEWTSPQELGNQLISTDKGYVPLKHLADIRDLRGSKGETVQVYKGAPAVGITVYAAEGVQIPTVRAQVQKAVAELNQASAGRYQIDQVEDHAGILSAALRDTSWMVILLAVVASLAVGITLRSATAGVLSLLTLLLAVGALLGGMWVAAIPLTLTSLGPVAMFALLFAGAGVTLFLRLGEESTLSQEGSLLIARELTKPILLGIVILFAGMMGIMSADWLKASDLSLLQDVLPISLIGTVVMAGVYGFIVPVLTATWIPEGMARPANRAAGKWSNYLISRWENAVRKGFLPYGVALTASLLAVVLLNKFVIVEDYNKTDAGQKTLSLAMVQGSSLDQAIQAAKVAEGRLLELAEIRDVYTVASRENLTFHLQLVEKDEWTRSRLDLEKELEKSLRVIAYTDPFAMVVSDDQKTRMEITVKGPSLHTARGIADEVVTFIRGLRWTDRDGNRIISDERIGSGNTGTHIAIKPKQEMLAHYRVSEGEIRRQLEGYLGKQAAGSISWNNTRVPINARFPENWMEYADQVKNILIRTPAGAVRLQDLADWSIEDEPSVYQRVDGDYVILISSAVSDPSWIEGLAFSIPLNVEASMPIPEGYRILSATQLEKEELEETNKKDTAGRMIAAAGVVATVLAAGTLLLRRLRDSLIALSLLPVLSGGVMSGLLLFDRPLNVMGFYGIAATAALTLQQSLLFLDRLHRTQDAGENVLDDIRLAASKSVPVLLIMFGAVLLAALPFGLGWGSGDDLHGPLFAALLIGVLLASYAVLVLLPAMYSGSEYRRLHSQSLTMPMLRKQLRSWWENEKVRRMDRLQFKRGRASREEKTAGQQGDQLDAGRTKPLSEEDFLPLTSSAKDANL
ncbi:efflux RND transporter permease subunit [Brevibacillus ruminantium]|uniref:Efflux RND transporter permease subunit n=1 Tax=Brevibacillus ruminantium TaxID=2950604 RepID=A0ABY4WHQ2_9BACL|nr:efflux RND transporter permease subunit [Brevibacillus ruminantium]USG66680.1 efflux RND transporter permease subunit [Brevibacillus ruminantium]